MKLKHLLLLIIIFCASCTSKVFTSTPLNRELTAGLDQTVMQWRILKNERITEQRLAYEGQRNGFTVFKLYTQRPGQAVATKILNYDLKASSYVNFKNAEIQVIKATPNSIRYIIKSPFLGRQDSFRD